MARAFGITASARSFSDVLTTSALVAHNPGPPPGLPAKARHIARDANDEKRARQGGSSGSEGPRFGSIRRACPTASMPATNGPRTLRHADAAVLRSRLMREAAQPRERAEDVEC